MLTTYCGQHIILQLFSVVIQQPHIFSRVVNVLYSVRFSNDFFRMPARCSALNRYFSANNLLRETLLNGRLPEIIS